jgi:hypothetical protein
LFFDEPVRFNAGQSSNQRAFSVVDMSGCARDNV